MKVICIDEIDYLYTKDESVVYNVFNWPYYSKSGLITIGIANTFNFPEKLQDKI